MKHPPDHCSLPVAVHYYAPRSTQMVRKMLIVHFRYYMKNQYGNSELFQEGKNGHVTELTAVGINNCQDGDCGLAYYQTKTCCPSKFARYVSEWVSE